MSGFEIAIVNSFIPKAALPASEAPKVQCSPLEKSSVKIILPSSISKTSVGVTSGVGKSVGVAVGGNQTIVGVDVIVGGMVGVTEGDGTKVGGAKHPPNTMRHENQRPKTKPM